MICIQVNLGLKNLNGTLVNIYGRNITKCWNFPFNCYKIDDHLNEKLTDFVRLDYKHDLLTYKR